MMDYQSLFDAEGDKIMMSIVRWNADLYPKAWHAKKQLSRLKGLLQLAVAHLNPKTEIEVLR